jgi:hypothetical protein
VGAFRGDVNMMTDAAAFDHVMIDIETMSLHPSKALILSIGLLEFDPTSTVEGLRIGRHEIILPDIEGQLILGRHVDRDTQKFWREKPVEARAHWAEYSGERCHIPRVLDQVREFVSTAKCVWAKGPQFDLSNLNGLREDVEYKHQLWHYRAPRDMRTFCEETAATRLMPRDEEMATKAPFKLIKHEPVSDCIWQAWQVWSHWQG